MLTNVADTSLVREDGRRRAGGDAVTVGRRSRRSPCASDRRLTAGRDGVAGWVLDSEVLAAVAAMRGEHAGCGRAYHDYSINRRGMFTKFLDAASCEPRASACGVWEFVGARHGSLLERCDSTRHETVGGPWRTAGVCWAVRH